MNERRKSTFEVVVTSFSRDKHENIAGRTPEATPGVKTSQKTVTAAEAITFCIKPLAHYLPEKLVKFEPLSPRETKCGKILYF